ncbi:MAG: hypothetical protein DHS80DRAFT_26165 [Piptocephalis tieghemiana]|nr:MAG: hypothetical protein DHS80DRAFT_26165 [Piptocephalis tieghemiana]
MVQAGPRQSLEGQRPRGLRRSSSRSSLVSLSSLHSSDEEPAREEGPRVLHLGGVGVEGEGGEPVTLVQVREPEGLRMGEELVRHVLHITNELVGIGVGEQAFRDGRLEPYGAIQESVMMMPQENTRTMDEWAERLSRVWRITARRFQTWYSHVREERNTRASMEETGLYALLLDLLQWLESIDLRMARAMGDFCVHRSRLIEQMGRYEAMRMQHQRLIHHRLSTHLGNEGSFRT